ncbi:hypothetical protein SAMN02745866_00504 [Alteromonadaceae bacterium Bs31]|nr:hypothetical protein SAMN02745866_00504 [Alteromonadaceae bacterium Bs31]
MYDKKSHSEWLSLIEVSGPFLAETVLDAHFPQRLDELEPSKQKMLRQAYDEWREAQDFSDPQFPELHTAWIQLVLKQGLELDEDDDADILKPASLLPESITLELPEHGLTIKPDFAVITSEGASPSLLIQIFPTGSDLEAVTKGDGWSASPVERMVQLCRASKSRMGLLTNGERWMLIDAPEGGVTTFASWYARLWGQEPTTLQAFINLLGIRRFFLDASQQLPALFDESLKHQDEVTDALGDQVRRAVEVLVQALDKADLDRDRELLKEVEPTELYEAGLTVMMRLVFLLSAEERGLLLLGEERYEAFYAVSTLRMQLREQAGLHSEEILSHRRDAWSRLLAIFRAVYGGIEHETLRMPALGGSLFDPDRFPFLEGRKKGSSWRYDAAQPLPIDNRTVLLLLDAIQLFKGRTLSYRALDVEQIGYVYEGLLERTVVRAKDITLELKAGKSVKKPWMTWGELEDARLSGEQKIKTLLEERTGSKAVKSRLEKAVSDTEKEKLLTACQGDQNLRDRLAPYYHFLKIDSWGYPLIYPKDAFMVATGSDRRETGTHYTPKSLTESIVRDTLEPVVYIGPAEGKEKQDWLLKTSAELLDLKICDLAMGSGAFLVQVCRYLSERLLEAWAKAETEGKAITANGVVVDSLIDQEPLTTDVDERSVSARRLISERCLYGVDINPLAVELAKLSIWLITLAKGRPFGFLDHNLKHGDSLLGITNVEQLYYLDMNPTKISEGGGVNKQLFAQKIEDAVNDAIKLRIELRQMPILDIHDVEVMDHLDKQSREKLRLPELVADAFVAQVLISGGKKADVSQISIEAGELFEGTLSGIDFFSRKAKIKLNTDLSDEKQDRKAFHWCLEFPEVFHSKDAGFDAVVGNPPYVGGQKISGALGKSVSNYLKHIKTWKVKSSVDLVVYFALHAAEIVHKTGSVGLVVRRSISEGKNKEAGLDQLISNGCVIYSAKTDISWPGEASVVVHFLHFKRGAWLSPAILNGKTVKCISSDLSQLSAGTPDKIAINKGRIFQGVILQGEGFHLSDKEKEILIEDRKNSSIVHPFIGGKEINSDPYCSPKSWVINFWDWSEEKAKSYEQAFSMVEKRVKPMRQRLNPKGEYVLRKPLPQKWWIYGEKRPALFEALGFNEHFSNFKNTQKLSRFLVIATGVTKFPSFTFLPIGMICSHKVCVLADDRYSMFGVVSSDVHSIWAWQNKTSMGGDLSSMVYAHGNIFETFPFPKGFFSDYRNEELETLGRQLYEARTDVMQKTRCGLTKFYNDYHNEDIQNQEIESIREIQIQLNAEVSKSYGFSDIKLDHGFHKVSYLPEGKNTRFGISENAREELLRRLALLNKEQSIAGANSSKKKNSKKERVKTDINVSQPDMFGG